MSQIEFECHSCHGKFTGSQDDDEAKAEYEREFGKPLDETSEEVVQICTTCYRFIGLKRALVDSIPMLLADAFHLRSCPRKACHDIGKRSEAILTILGGLVPQEKLTEACRVLADMIEEGTGTKQ